MKFIHTKKAPAAIGPYSQATRTGDLIFISGQLPINPETNEFSGNDIKQQTRQSLINIKAILKQEGLNLNYVLKTTVLLQNISRDFGDMNAVYAEMFGDHKPARAAYQVAELPKKALVEIEAIAIAK